MPKINEYDSVNASQIDDNDQFVVEVDGETKSITSKDVSQMYQDFTALSGTSWDGSNKTKTLSANLSLTFAPSGNRLGQLIIIQDGTGGRTLTIDGNAVTISSSANSVTFISYIYDAANSKYRFFVSSSVLALTGAPDVTAPTIVSATAIDSTHVRVVFSENVIPTNAGWSIYKQDILETTTASAVTGSGTTWDFTIGGTAMDDTMTLKISYNSSTGNTLDGAGNELATVSLADVTNSIGGGPVALNAPTGVTLGTATSSTQPLTWTDTNSSPNENGYKVYANTANNFGTAALKTTTAANATSYTVTGLTSSTTYYYWIVAAGNGTTTSDSSPSTVQSGATAAPSLDADATAYISAQEAADSITIGTTDRSAINQLFLDLKDGANPFPQGKALYMFYGSTMLNALSPTNDDAHFRATLGGSPSIDSTGITLNGTSDYLNTHLNPSTDLASLSESYAWYNGIDADSGCDIGVYVGGGGTALFSRNTGNFLMRIQQGADNNIGANSSAIGRYVASLRTPDIGGSTYSRRVLKNGTQIYSSPSSANSVTNGLLTIGAYNVSGGGVLGSLGGYRNARYGIFWIGLELTDAQMGQLDTAISNFITATSRT